MVSSIWHFMWRLWSKFKEKFSQSSGAVSCGCVPWNVHLPWKPGKSTDSCLSGARKSTFEKLSPLIIIFDWHLMGVSISFPTHFNFPEHFLVPILDLVGQQLAYLLACLLTEKLFRPCSAVINWLAIFAVFFIFIFLKIVADLFWMSFSTIWLTCVLYSTLCPADLCLCCYFCRSSWCHWFCLWFRFVFLIRTNPKRT